MEVRKRNVIIGKAGGNASKKSLNYKISIPAPWIEILGVDAKDKEVNMCFDGKKIIIQKGELKMLKLKEVLKDLKEKGYDYVIEIQERFDDEIFPIYAYEEDVDNDNVEVEYNQDYVLIKNTDTEEEMKVIKERVMNEAEKEQIDAIDKKMKGRTFQDKVYEQYNKLMDMFLIHGDLNDENLDKLKKMIK